MQKILAGLLLCFGSHFAALAGPQEPSRKGGISAKAAVEKVLVDAYVLGFVVRYAASSKAYFWRRNFSATYYPVWSGSDATDDAALVEAAGGTVVVVRGDTLNRKITEPDDLEWARRHLPTGGDR